MGSLDRETDRVADAAEGFGYAMARLLIHRHGAGEDRIDEPSSEFFRNALPAAGVVLESLDLQGNSYTRMAGAMIDELVECLPIELVVLAHSTPDFAQNDIAAVAVMGRAQGAIGGAFAVADDGSLTMLGAFDVAVRHGERLGLESLLLIGLDHGVFPYALEIDPGQRVDGDTAAAVLLRRSDSRRSRVVRRVLADPAGPGAARAAALEILVELRSLEGSIDATAQQVVLGAGLLLLDPDVGSIVEGLGGPAPVLSDSGNPVTSIWSAARVGEHHRAPVSLILIDADAGIGAVVGASIAVDLDARDG